MNYTKGEWKVSNKSFGGAETDGNLVIWSPDGIVAMACTIHEGLINAEANANLIAVAPDMYEALKLTKETVITKTEDGYLITYDALRAIIKALTKAEGK